MEHYEREKAAGRLYLEGDNINATLCTKRFDRSTGAEAGVDRQDVDDAWLDMQIAVKEAELAGFNALRVDVAALPDPAPEPEPER